MSLESAIADLVSASTQLTQSVNVTRATVEATRDTVIAQEAPVTTAKDATTASATAATTDTATTASKLTAAAADYAAQKTTKGLAVVQTSADSELKDRLHRRDPARHPFRGARPSLVMDFVRRECHRNNAAGNLEQVDLSSFMTFTRGSTATYVGPDGLIKTAGVNEARYGYDPVTGEALGLLVEEQRTNLYARSTNLNWLYKTRASIIANSALAVDGTMTAITIIEDTSSVSNHYANTSSFSLSANTYSYSVFLKAAGRRGKLYVETNPYTGSASATFDLVNGVCTSASSSAPELVGVLGKISQHNDGWYKCSLIFTASVAVSVPAYIILANSSNTDSYTGDGASGVLACCPQLEVGSFPTSYIPTPATFTGRASTKTYFDSNGVLQTAASGVAVTDYGYVDGRWVSKGLSLEPQATNLFLQSINFASGWSKNGTFVTSTSTEPSPTGEFNAVTCTFPAEASNVSGFYSGITLTAGQTVTASVFVKPTNSDVFRFGFDSAVFGTNGYALFTFSTGSVYTNVGAGAPIIPTMKKLSGGWYRVSITRTAVADGTTNVVLYNGVGGASVLTLYGAQAEVGSYATSYIPTTTAQVTRAADTSTSAQVTRAADDAKREGAVDWWAPDGETLRVNFMCPSAIQDNAGLLELDSGVSYEGVSLRPLAGTNVCLTIRKTQAQINEAISAQTLASKTSHVIGVSRSYAGRAACSINNGSVVQSSTYTIHPKCVRLKLGYQGLAGAQRYLNGYIKQLTYFPRQLSDADLQALTILED